MEKVTIFKFHYKDHLVRAVSHNNTGYLLGPDIMPLFGYKKQPLVDINHLLDEGSDKKFIYGVPVITLLGVCFLEQYPRVKRKKAQKVSDWVSDEVMPILEGRMNLPDEVRTESWEEEDFKRYLEEVEDDEENRLSTHKDVLKFKIGGETVAKAKIDTQKCTFTRALAGLLTAVIFSEYSNQPDCLDATRTLNAVTNEVMVAIQQSYNDRLASEDY